MKILVTGGAGFIGSNIVDAYINDGHEVVIVDNLSTGKRENLNPKAKFYHVDICNPEIEEIFAKEKPDILNHHAAQIDVRKSVADPLFDCKVNVLGFLNLMEAAKRSRVKKIIFASSIAVYGEQRYFPADEEHSIDPTSPYGIAKLTCEKYLHHYHTQHGVQYVAFRYANVYGPRQNSHGEAGVVAIFINKMLLGESPIINGSGRQTRDFVYVDDVVELNRRVVNCGLHCSSNVGTGVETEIHLLFENLNEIIGKELKTTHGLPINGGQMRSVIISNHSEKIFSYSPKTQLRDGLKATIDWFRKTQITEK